MSIAAVPCPLCGLEGDFPVVRNTSVDAHIGRMGALYGNLKKTTWRCCSRCGFVHQNPRPTPEALNALYAESVYHPSVDDDDLEKYRKFAHWYYKDKVAWALEKAGLTSGVIFEAGAGQGGALELFRERGFEVRGVEPDPGHARFARERLHLDVDVAMLDDSTTLDRPVDLVFSNHVFEHVEDLHAAGRALERIVRPGGYVFTCLPTYARNRSDLSLRWMNAGHLSMFTHQSLNQLLARHGFTEVAHSYRAWRKEIDDVWHLARRAPVTPAPETFYEDARRVAFFINVINPLRSAARWPVFHDYARKYGFLAGLKWRVVTKLRGSGEE